MSCKNKHKIEDWLLNVAVQRILAAPLNGAGELCGYGSEYVVDNGGLRGHDAPSSRKK